MAPRHSAIRADHIEYSFWLVFASDGSVRFLRGEPNIGRHERAMACTARLPLSLFRTPTLKATIGVAGPEPGAFAVDVKAASEALSWSLGVDVDLQVLPAT